MSVCFLASLRYRSKKKEILETVTEGVLLKANMLIEQFTIGEVMLFLMK